MKTKVRKASIATDKLLGHWDVAEARLRVCRINGAGVLADPSNAKWALMDAKAEIDKALAILGDTDWPRPEDYD